MLLDKNNFSSALNDSLVSEWVIRKCCNIGYALMNKTCVKSEKIFTTEDRGFKLIFGSDCGKNKQKIAPFSSDYFNISKNGDVNIFLGKYVIVKKYFDYCIDYIDTYSDVSVIICTEINNVINIKEYCSGKR